MERIRCTRKDLFVDKIAEMPATNLLADQIPTCKIKYPPVCLPYPEPQIPQPYTPEEEVFLETAHPKTGHEECLKAMRPTLGRANKIPEEKEQDDLSIFFVRSAKPHLSQII